MNAPVVKKPPNERRSRLGFLGVGWIGRNRMEAMVAAGNVEVAFIVEPSNEAAKAALLTAPEARILGCLDELLQEDVDGIVIATPSAQHATQSIKALQAGHAVFCQKPLGRSGKEVDAVLAAAKKADRLLGLDLSYRHTKAMQQIKRLLQSGELGDVTAIDLTFHNAYGPDKPWFYRRAEAGGGCVIDLGVHLIDLALWALDFPNVATASSEMLCAGRLLGSDTGDVEDYASANLLLANGTIVRLACSWRLNAGCDCVIDASFYGTKGGAALRNVNGSFYDFTAELFIGTQTMRLVDPPDDWGGRAAVDWATKLAHSRLYDPAADQFAAVATAMDRIYESYKSSRRQ